MPQVYASCVLSEEREVGGERAAQDRQLLKWLYSLNSRLVKCVTCKWRKLLLSAPLLPCHPLTGPLKNTSANSVYPLISSIHFMNYCRDARQKHMRTRANNIQLPDLLIEPSASLREDQFLGWFKIWIHVFVSHIKSVFCEIKKMVSAQIQKWILPFFCLRMDFSYTNSNLLFVFHIS